MKDYRYILFIILIAVPLTGCDDYLDEEPDKSTAVVPETIDDLEALFNDYTSFYDEPSSELVFGTDDYQLTPTMYDSLSSSISAKVAQYATWDVDYLPNTDRQYWPKEWNKIFIANMVLENLPDMTGGDDKERNNLEAEAHFIIAYSYFKLATVYCLPFTSKNSEELGLPIKESTSFEEPVERASLEETYNFIEENLEQAFKITRPFSEVHGKNRSWRASTAAVNGFAARYYLTRYDYAKAELYADKALDEYDNLRNYNGEMHYSNIPEEVTIMNPDPENISIKYPYTHDMQSDPTDRMEFGESYYYRFLDNESWNYFPSEELLNLYDEDNDLRYKYHIVENYSYVKGAVDPPFSYPGYVFFYESDIPSGPSVPEMLLTKGEAQIRQGQWKDGIETVNQLRAARMDVNAPSDKIYLDASSQEDALTKVLEERRREMPFVHRWLDIRRYNNNDDSSDDVIITRTFYPYSSSSIQGHASPETYTLDKQSKKYARPIPESEIISSEGAIEQNPY